jgi:haloacetate dehalogenase
MTGYFDGFEQQQIDVTDGELRVRLGGKGPALLLLHGNPQTHAMWNAVVPALADAYTIVCPDLRGYGFSHKPDASPDHAPYAKRAMARDMVELMDRLGHRQFFLAGHDRGARVSHRLALDFPDRVRRLAVLDIVPTVEHFERADADFAMGYYHWFWLAQAHPYPEKLITKAPEEWFLAHTTRGPKNDFFHPSAMADYLAAVRNPEMVRGMCEDYRAAATIDLDHDRASRAAGEKIACPLLVLWGAAGKIGKWYDPMEIWRAYCAADVTGGAIAAGHYLAEEAPDDVAARFRAFFV